MKMIGAGRALMTTGVICIIIYVLISLYGLSATGLQIGKLLLIVGVVALIAGIAVRLSRART